MRTTSFRELAGLWVGVLLAPFIAAVSGARRGRMFHPEGLTFRAHVDAVDGLGEPWAELARRLEGQALVRFSGALWRGKFEHLDVLGAAVRLLGNGAVSSQRESGDQDLLFATIISPLTMGLSPLTTDAHDYLANKYWAVSPFDVGWRRNVKFRLSPARAAQPHRSSRNAALDELVREGPVPFRVQARHTFELSWHTVGTLWLVGRADVDQEALRFSPFQNGRGIAPRGFVHALRRAAYPASQLARPKTAAAARASKAQ